MLSAFPMGKLGIINCCLPGLTHCLSQVFWRPRGSKWLWDLTWKCRQLWVTCGTYTSLNKYFPNLLPISRLPSPQPFSWSFILQPTLSLYPGSCKARASSRPKLISLICFHLPQDILANNSNSALSTFPLPNIWLLGFPNYTPRS